MQFEGEHSLLSATDLIGFLECEHLTLLNWRLASGELKASEKSARDESAELIARKGNEHERAYLARLREAGRAIVDIASDGGSLENRVSRTVAAMRDGVEVIYQATLRHGNLFGHADFLRCVERPSALGAWSYEVADTKLARSPKAKFLVQLSFYSHLLAAAQGLEPEAMHVVLGDQTERAFRCADYMHYFHALLGRFATWTLVLAEGRVPATYPLPCGHCDLCDWSARCEEQRVRDDHLCQVANIRRTQWDKLQGAGVMTMAALGSLLPDSQIPNLAPETLEKLRSQAALQDYAKRTGEQRLEVLGLDPDRRRGFYRMPRPDAGDMFFDMEGDPLEIDGLEYLFGVGFMEEGNWRFLAFWAHERGEERVAFEQFMDFAAARRRAHPGAHIFHYASYEETALKRLASSHATREVELDNLLREGVLVDLYKVVREAIRISEPSYSIKYVEHFYRGARAGDVQNAGASIVFYERWRETHDPQLLRDIEAYNHDDVESTRQLHEWLLTLRPSGLEWKDRVGVSESVQEDPTKAQLAEQRLIPHRQQLVDVLPADRGAWQPEHHLRELTYQLLDFHRRADKPAWWEMFSRMDMTEDELLEDAECLAALTIDPVAPPRAEKRSTIYTYVAPEQETKLATGDSCTRTDTAQSIGTLQFDETSRRVLLKLGPKKQPLPPQLSIGPGGPVQSQALVNAVYRFADSLLTEDGRYAALLSFLFREPPKLAGRSPGEPVIRPGDDLVQGSVAAAKAMDRTYLYVQGPPGAGKTYTGARMILGLISQGWRVGIMSNSHKAINNLLAGVMHAAREQGVRVHAVKKSTSGKPETEFDDPIGGVEDVYVNGEVWESHAQLIAGTAWLFADIGGDQQLDALFVDEAGQVCLANLVAAGTSARNLVLLGDQMQLSQPVQGVHPGRSGDSALDYLLDGAATILPERGIFLAKTWRMHPEVCRFISNAVYEGRLEPEEHNHRRVLVLSDDAHPLLQPAGLVHASVEHQGRSQGCEEEAALVVQVYESALRQHFTDKQGRVHAIRPENILVVAPYNVQVNLLKRRLPAGARVGTVDKFQGQEGELVIVSMTTSSEEYLPSNIEFLYSKNRLNVAISRAKCLAIVIANPALLAIRCKTPEQMALVNMLCWAAEVGRSIRS